VPELPPLQDDRERLLEMPLDAIDPDELATAPLAAFDAQIDTFLRARGLPRLGSTARAQWEEASRESARRVLLYMLGRDLAYRTRVRTVDEAHALTDALLRRWPVPARFVVSSDLHGQLDADGEPPRTGGFGGGTRLTAHTFELAILAIATDQIALLIVTGED
jgi:hypothetical protein